MRLWVRKQLLDGIVQPLLIDPQVHQKLRNAVDAIMLQSEATCAQVIQLGGETDKVGGIG